MNARKKIRTKSQSFFTPGMWKVIAEREAALGRGRSVEIKSAGELRKTIRRNKSKSLA